MEIQSSLGSAQINRNALSNLTQMQLATNKLSYLANKNNINLVPYNDTGCLKFISLPNKTQEEIISALNNYIHLCEYADIQNISLTTDNRIHAWWSIKQLGLRPPDDLFDKIEKNDIIEIYNNQSIQVFRSFGMFRYLSYTLMEIFSFEWHELYDRDEFVFNRMMKVVDSVLSGKLSGIIRPDFPNHTVTEVFSEKRNHAMMKHRLFSPLYNESMHPSGFLSAFQIISFSGHTEVN